MRAATQSLANNTNCTNDDTLLNCLRDLDGDVLLNEYFSSNFVSSSPKVRLPQMCEVLKSDVVKDSL